MNTDHDPLSVMELNRELKYRVEKAEAEINRLRRLLINYEDLINAGLCNLPMEYFTLRDRAHAALEGK